MSSNAIILGLDPGLASFGYGVVMDRARGPLWLRDGVIKTQRDNARGVLKDQRIRIGEISEQLHELIDEVEPVFCCFEQFKFNHQAKQSTGMYSLMRVIGRLDEILAAHAIPSIELPTQQIKKIVTGRGRCKKPDVRRAITTTLDYTPANEHTTDALAAAVAGCVANRPGFPN